MSRSVEHELATQASHLRGLARALLGCDDGDDLVQDTALQALRVRGEPVAPRAWLAMAMRRIAGKQRRAARRRSRRETAFAERAERHAAPTPFEAAERRETLLRLTAALVALAEPYRGTLQARYFEELPPAAIAARDGVPVATVKTRLQRGLALLRERLQQEGGDWRAALVGTFGLRDLTPATPAVVAAGVFVMGTGVKLALGGLAAALLVAAGLWWAGGDGPPAVPVAAVPDGDAVAVVAATESLPSERRVVAGPVAPADEPAAAVAIVHGRCVDADGEPLAGCVVRVHAVAGGAGRELRWQQRHGAFVWAQPQAITTDATGTFHVEVPPTGPRVAELEVAADGCVAPAWRWAQLRGGDVHDVGDVVVRRLVRVHLAVKTPQEQPLSWISLRFRQNDDVRDDAYRQLVRTVHTDHRGMATLTLPEGRFSIVTTCFRGRDALGFPSGLVVPGDEAEFSTSLTFDSDPFVETITGWIVDSNGVPVPNARIASTIANGDRAGKRRQFETATTEDGRFVLGRPANDWWSDDLVLHVVAEGHEQLESSPVSWGTSDVQLVLGAALSREFVVRDPSGAPVSEFDLTLNLTSRYPMRWEERYERGPHPDGVVVCDDLPSGDYELTIEPRDPSLTGHYERPIVVVPAASDVVEVTLPHAVRRVLQVRTVEGERVVGARFQRLAGATRSEGTPPDVGSVALTFQELRRTAGDRQVLCFEDGETDTEGEAVLQGPADERFSVRVRGGGNLPIVVHDVDLADPAPLIVTMQRAASLRARFGPAGFVRWLGAYLAGGDAEVDPHLELIPAQWTEVREKLRGHPVVRLMLEHASSNRTTSALLGPDGTARIEGLTAGMWLASLRAQINSSTDNSWMTWDLGPMPFADGQALEREFDLAAAIPARLRGTLVIDGVATEGRILVSGGGELQSVNATVGADGTFDVWVLPGLQQIEFLCQPDLHLIVADHYEVASDADVHPTFVVATGELRLHVVDGDHVGAANVLLWCSDPATSRRRLVRTDLNGDAVRRTEVGTFRVHCLPRSLQDDERRSAFRREHRDDPAALERRYLDLGTITVLPGDTRTHTIVLPPEYAH